MKKNLLALTIMLVFAVALFAQNAPLVNEAFREELTGRAQRHDFISTSPTPQVVSTEISTPEKCENCPQEKPEDYICENENGKQDCCKVDNENKSRGSRNVRRESLSNKLNLTDTQKQKIETLRENHTKANEKRRADLIKLETDKMEAIRNNKPKDAKKIVDKISKIRTEMEKSRIDLMVSISNELTPEQREMMAKPRGKKIFENKPQGRGRN